LLIFFSDQRLLWEAKIVFILEFYFCLSLTVRIFIFLLLTSILRIIQASCEAERVDRALDCVNELFLRKSIGVAVQIATKTEQIQLAQMINQILRREVATSERQKNRSIGLPSLSSYGGSYTQAASYSAKESAESDDDVPHSTAPPAKRAKISNPSRSTSTRGRTAAMYVSDDENQTAEAAMETQAEDGDGDDDDAILNESLSKRKAASSEAMDVDNDDQSAGGAPINPFSKATKASGPNAGSIFDTIKTMKSAPTPAAAPVAAEAKGRQKNGKAAAAAPKAKQQTLPGAGGNAAQDTEGGEADKADANKKKRKLFS
jgi:hypothetical protein